MFRRKKSGSGATTDSSGETTPDAKAREPRAEDRLEPAAPSFTEVKSGKPDGESKMQPSKPSSSGYVPEIPRRTLDLPGAPSRRGTPPRGGEAKKLTVGPEISLTGEITACDSLVVEGNVDATLENSRQLEVTETGHFKGKVIIDEAEIGGRFEGTLEVRDTLRVRSTGHVTGTVRFGRLEVELGGKIDGTISVYKDDTSS